MKRQKRLLQRITVGMAILSCVWPASLPAQNGRNVLEGLFRAFTDIDRARRERKEEEARARQEAEARNQQQVLPAQPAYAGGDVLAFRQYITSFANSITALAQRLEALSADPATRALLPEVYELRSRSSLLAGQAMASTQLNPSLVSEYSAIDGMWRSFSHRLKRQRGIDSQLRGMSMTLDTYCDSICKMLSLEADYSHIDAVVAAAGAAASVEALVDDIRFELAGRSECQGLVDQGIQCQQQFKQLAILLNGASHSEAVGQAKVSASDWHGFANGLMNYRNARLLRAVARTQDRLDHLLLILRVTPEIPHSFVAALSEMSAEESAALIARYGAKLFGSMPRGRARLLVSGDVLASRFLGFADLARGQAGQDDLAVQLAPLEGSWREVRPYIEQLGAAEATSRMQAIDGNLQRMRSIVGVFAGASREELLQACAELYQFSANLEAGVQSQMALGLFTDRNARVAVVGQCGSFRSSIEGMIGSIQNGRTGDRLRGQFGQATQHWQALTPLLDSVQRVPRGYGIRIGQPHLLQYRQQGDSLMAKLAVMLGG